MKALLLIPVFGVIFFLATLAGEFVEAWNDRGCAKPRLLATWNYMHWDEVFLAAFEGMLLGAALAAIRLLLF